MAWLSNVVSLKRFRCSGQGLFYLAQMGLGREVPLSLRSPLRLSPPAMAMGPRVNNEIPELTFDYLTYLTYLPTLHVPWVELKESHANWNPFQQSFAASLCATPAPITSAT